MSFSKSAVAGFLATAGEKAANPTLTLDQFRRAVCEEWFSTSAAFLANVVHRPLNTTPYSDSMQVRALMVFMHYGVAQGGSVCPWCKKIRGNI